MAYDNNTYGASPFGSAATTTAQSGERKGARSPAAEDALSDHLPSSQRPGAQVEENSC